MGCSTSLKMAPFDRPGPYTTFYWSAIVYIALSGISSYMKRDFGRKIKICFIPPLHSTGGGSSRNIAMTFGMEKLEMVR